MKTAEEKIQFKNHFFKLGQGRLILKDDAEYWQVFWQWPSAASHIFDLLTAYDIQTVRDHNLPNFLTLVHVLCRAVVDGQQGAGLQNCVRMLAKLLPFLFEMHDYERIERRVFLEEGFDPMSFANKHPCTTKHPCITRMTAPLSADALAPALVHALVGKMLGPTGGVWETGLGRSGSYASIDHGADEIRADVLRLLLVLISRQFYEAPTCFTATGNVFMTLLVTSEAGPLGRLVCSLTNVVCRAGRATRGDTGLEDLQGSQLAWRHWYVLACGQLLASSVLYEVPGHHHFACAGKQDTDQCAAEATGTCTGSEHTGNAEDRNLVRQQLSRVSAAADLSFLASHLLAILRPPENSEHLHPPPLALSAMILLRHLYLDNATFQEQVAARLASKLVPCVLHHIYANYDRPEHEHVVKLASCFLVELSGKARQNRQLLGGVPESFMEQFPPEFRIGGAISTRDFAVIHVCQILLTLAPPQNTVSKYTTLAIRPFLLARLTEFLYNVIPCTSPQIAGSDNPALRLANVNTGGGISYRACTYVTSVVAAFSTRAFLVASPAHAQLLALLLRALCTAVAKNPSSARSLLVTFLENEAMYDNIWTTVQGLSRSYFLQGTLTETETNSETETEAETKSETDTGAETAETGEESDENVDSEHSAFKTDNLAYKEDSISQAETHSFDLEDDLDVLAPVPPAGMSEQRSQKWPRETPVSETWGGTGSIHIIVVVLIPFLKSSLGGLWCRRADRTADGLYAVSQRLGECGLAAKIAADKRLFHYDSWPETPVHMLVLTWNANSCGWLAGIVGWDVYAGTDIVRSYISADKSLMGNISSGLAMFTKFASGWSSFSGGGAPDAVSAQEDTLAFSTNVWHGTRIRLFSTRVQDRRLFGLRLSSVGSTASVNDLTTSLARKFRMGSRSGASSVVSTPIDEIPEFPKLTKRDSISSLHSLNTLNRARSYTPRSSISNS